jgi:hypothetical protein
MADLPNPPILSTNGTYEVATDPGREYLLTLYGVWDSGEIVLWAWNEALEDYTSVQSGSWTTDTEVRFVAPSHTVRLALSGVGAGTAIGVTLIPLV